MIGRWNSQWMLSSVLQKLFYSAAGPSRAPHPLSYELQSFRDAAACRVVRESSQRLASRSFSPLRYLTDRCSLRSLLVSPPPPASSVSPSVWSPRKMHSIKHSFKFLYNVIHKYILLAWKNCGVFWGKDGIDWDVHYFQGENWIDIRADGLMGSVTAPIKFATQGTTVCF